MTPKILYDQETNMWYRPEDGKPEPEPMTKCPDCGNMSVRYRQEAYGDSWSCTTQGCLYHHYYSLGD